VSLWKVTAPGYRTMDDIMAPGYMAPEYTAPEQTAMDDIMSLTQFVKRYPDIVTEQQIRWQIFKRNQNGLADSGAITKKGGKWFIVIPNYRAWLLESDA
jgi:hypothetical protein